jgi:hypothetical protein
MSNLASKFDIKRGYDHSTDNAAINESFKPHSSVGATPLAEGEIVHVMSDGTVARATCADYGGAASVAALATLLSTDKNLWLVLTGTTETDYDGLQHGNVSGSLGWVPWKVVAIRGLVMFETTSFAAGTYTVGEGVSVINGEIVSLVENPGLRRYAEVIEYNVATGVLTLCT